MKKTVISFFFFFLLIFYSKAQLIINEVSQGPSGTKEYVELIVVGTPSCSSVPCLDLRGYYIDDNNGNNASGTGTGIAQGCIRFKNTAFWSCIPIGTLIVIYNDIDQNPSIPSDDLSMTDGNCKLVIPVSNCSLLEMNTDFPSLSSAAYPTTGFTACADWAALAMANGDDSFQTADPSGTPTFTISWGNNTINPLIYFSGTSTGTVAYMANIADDDPNNQANWTRVATAANETPGAPNNTANAAWINSMNNSCTVLTPLAITLNSTDPGCACDGAITAIASGGTGNYSYSWAPSGVTTATASGLCAGSYTVTVTSAGGCSQTAVATLVANTSLTMTVTSATICSGQSATLTATGADDYVWSTGATIDSITESPAATTSYTVTGTTNGCTGTATGTITVGSALAVTVNSETICSGQSATLAAIGADDYVWSTGATIDSITESPVSTTSYTVTGTSNGCTGTATGTITVGGALALAVNSETVCSGQSATLTATGADDYVWSTGATINSITESPVSTTSYTVTGTSNGCMGTATGTITVGGALALTVNSETICSGQSATLTATGADDYVWSTGATVNSITESPAATTSYTVTGTANGCTGTATGTITVGSALAVTVNSETICSGQSATLSATGADDYVWSTGATINSITESPVSITSYTVTGTSNGCTGTATGTVEVNALPLVVFGADILSGCEPFCSNFTDASTVENGIITSWNWDFGNGAAADIQQPQYCFNTEGNYSVTLTVSTNTGCSASVTNTDMIQLTGKPVADFEIPESRTILDPVISFTDNSTGADTWSWNFGDTFDSLNNTSDLVNPAHSYTESGDYCVSLVVANTSGCADTTLKCFLIESEYTFYIPNTFSPNGDGVNDEFYGKGEGILEFEITIFDRWGSIVFMSKDMNEHWDGKPLKGSRISPQDSYVYDVVIKDTKKERHQYTGSIVIAR